MGLSTTLSNLASIHVLILLKGPFPVFSVLCFVIVIVIIMMLWVESTTNPKQHLVRR